MCGCICVSGPVWECVLTVDTVALVCWIWLASECGVCVCVCVRNCHINPPEAVAGSGGGVTPPSMLYALLNPRETHWVRLEDWNLPTTPLSHKHIIHSLMSQKQRCMFSVFPSNCSFTHSNVKKRENSYSFVLYNLQWIFFFLSAFTFERQKSHLCVSSYQL